MSSTDRYIPICIGDFQRDTSHLVASELGAYLSCLFHAWTHDGALPLDSEHRRRIARMTPQEWRHRESIIMAFWHLESDHYEQKRLTFELNKARELYAARIARTAAARAARHNSVTEQSRDVVTDYVTCSVTTTPSPSPSPSPSVIQDQKQLQGRKQSKKLNGHQFTLPNDIDPDLWAEFIEMRQRIRKPATDRAKWLIIGKLANLEKAGHNTRHVLQQSIRNSWQDVFPLRSDK